MKILWIKIFLMGGLLSLLVMQFSSCSKSHLGGLVYGDYIGTQIDYSFYDTYLPDTSFFEYKSDTLEYKYSITWAGDYDAISIVEYCFDTQKSKQYNLPISSHDGTSVTFEETNCAYHCNNNTFVFRLESNKMYLERIYYNKSLAATANVIAPFESKKFKGAKQ